MLKNGVINLDGSEGIGSTQWESPRAPTVARRCVSLLTDESMPEDLAHVRQISDLLRSEAMPDGGRDVRPRVVHPQQRLNGATLDFTPAKLRAWYEDGLPTARAGAALEV